MAPGSQSSVTAPPPTRELRGAPDPPRRRRTGAIVAMAVVAVIAIVVVALLALGGSDGGKQASASRRTAVDLPAGPVTAESAGAPVAAPADAAQRVLSTVRAYVDAAVVRALRSTRASDADLGAVLDAGVVARLSGPDRAVLVDEGLPKATGNVAVTAAPVAVTVLVDADGTPVLASASLALDVRADTDAGRLSIRRLGEVVLAPDPSGAWKVTAYDLAVQRSGAGIAAAATSAVSGG